MTSCKGSYFLLCQIKWLQLKWIRLRNLLLRLFLKDKHIFYEIVVNYESGHDPTAKLFEEFTTVSVLNVNTILLFCDVSFIIACSKLVYAAIIFSQITFHHLIQIVNTVPQLKIGTEMLVLWMILCHIAQNVASLNLGCVQQTLSVVKTSCEIWWLQCS